MGTPERALDPDDGSILIDFEVWAREWGGFLHRYERGYKLAFHGRVRVPPDDWEAMLAAFDRVFALRLNNDDYRALAAAIEEDDDGERDEAGLRRVGPAIRGWAEEVAAKILEDQSATQAAALVPWILRIVMAHFGHVF